MKSEGAHDNPGVCRDVVPQGRPGHGLLLPGTQVSAQHQDVLVSTSMLGDIVAYCLFYYIFFISILIANEIGILTNIYLFIK